MKTFRWREPVDSSVPHTAHLDVTSSNPRLSDLCEGVFKNLITNYDKAQRCSEALLEPLDMLAHPVSGFVTAGGQTRRHQHVSPVCHYVVTGQKQWHFWHPRRTMEETYEVQPDHVISMQRAGELVYFPPGWWHEVFTLAGEPVVAGVAGIPTWGRSESERRLERKIVSQHVVCFMNTPETAMTALALLSDRMVTESQKSAKWSQAVARRMKQRVYALSMPVSKEECVL
jgi:hypothetical protein